ncbi:hypothetical protein [Streptomyces sp. NBC_01012]|nr:hypothetical protein OG623_25950 [Streptomyces sp. NBC_01012]
MAGNLSHVPGRCPRRCPGLGRRAERAERAERLLDILLAGLRTT